VVILEQAAYSLQSLARHSSDHKWSIVRDGGLDQLLLVLEKFGSEHPTLTDAIMLALVNIAVISSVKEVFYEKKVVNTISSYLTQFQRNRDIQTSSLWAILNASLGHEANTQLFVSLDWHEAIFVTMNLYPVEETLHEICLELLVHLVSFSGSQPIIADLSESEFLKLVSRSKDTFVENVAVQALAKKVLTIINGASTPVVVADNIELAAVIEATPTDATESKEKSPSSTTEMEAENNTADSDLQSPVTLVSDRKTADKIDDPESTGVGNSSHTDDAGQTVVDTLNLTEEVPDDIPPQTEEVPKDSEGQDPAETEEREVIVTEAEESEVVVTETEENEVVVTETEENEVVVTETEENEVVVTKTEENEVVVTETEENEVVVTETEEKEVPTAETEEKVLVKDVHPPLIAMQSIRVSEEEEEEMTEES
jgi:hypothetical protein